MEMQTATHGVIERGKQGQVLLLLLICLGTFIIGFTTSGWQRSGGHRNGLWESCAPIKSVPVYHVATQVLMCLSLIGLVFAIILALVYLLVHGLARHATSVALVAISVITTILMCIGLTVYGTQVRDAVHWSFGVTAVSNILCLIASVATIMQFAAC